MSESPEPWRDHPTRPSLPEVFRSVAIPVRAPGWWNLVRRFMAFSGPGYLIAVGYMDPGNWATDLAAGSQFNYSLLSVIILSNCIAVLLQYLALKFGVATGRDLAQACRDSFHPSINFLLWIAAEVAIAACDLAEVVGCAIALNLLFGLPLIVGVVLTSLDVLAILFLQSKGFRLIEALVITLMAIIAGCFVVEIFLARPEWGPLFRGCVPDPQILRNPAMLYVAVGILGATVMPHNLYLHSSIVQTRRFRQTQAGKREAIAFGTVDLVIALSLALIINAAILIVAAAVFYKTGRREVAEIQQAYQLLSPLLGAGAASVLFAVALLCSGQNSTLTGTMAGQIVMEGFLHLQMPPFWRRLITRSLAIIPAVAVTAWSGSAGTSKLLILSQVVLSMQLSFAVIPLVMFTSDRQKMGVFVNSSLLRVVSWTVAGLIVLVNLWLLI